MPAFLNPVELSPCNLGKSAVEAVSLSIANMPEIVPKIRWKQ